MSLSTHVLSASHDLPIRCAGPVHSGKVRSVYWLTPKDSARLIAEKKYPVHPDSALGIMVITDRISAFECLWNGEGDLHGIPGKGAALNAISQHWFALFRQAGLPAHHIVDTPHPLVWIVQRARPIMIEAIVRQYLTGSLWRAYSAGARSLCGITLPDNLKAHQRLAQPLITPSTKGVMRGIPGIPEADDVNVSRQDIINNLSAFGFATEADVTTYEDLLLRGFSIISEALRPLGQLFVDTKFEFGYVRDPHTQKPQLSIIDEVGTPDSSRIWDADAYAQGRIVENSKEAFRQLLLHTVSDPDVLLNKNRMEERITVAAATRLPASVMLETSHTYVALAEKIIGSTLHIPSNPRAEIIDTLRRQYNLIND